MILRKAYGGAYVALNSKSIGADLVFAWPNAEIVVMVRWRANIIFAREIAKSDDPEATRAKKIEEYKEKFANPYVAKISRYGRRRNRSTRYTYQADSRT